MQKQRIEIPQQFPHCVTLSEGVILPVGSPVKSSELRSISLGTEWGPKMEMPMKLQAVLISTSPLINGFYSVEVNQSLCYVVWCFCFPCFPFLVWVLNMMNGKIEWFLLGVLGIFLRLCSYTMQSTSALGKALQLSTAVKFQGRSLCFRSDWAWVVWKGLWTLL